MAKLDKIRGIHKSHSWAIIRTVSISEKTMNKSCKVYSWRAYCGFYGSFNRAKAVIFFADFTCHDAVFDFDIIDLAHIQQMISYC